MIMMIVVMIDDILINFFKHKEYIILRHCHIVFVVRCRDAHQLDHGCREARFHFLSLGVGTLLAEKLLAGLDFMSNCSLNCVRMCGRCGGFLG